MAVKFTSYLDKVAAKIENANRRNLRDATLTLYKAVKRKFTGARSGRSYPLPGGGGGTYTASAAGEPPASRTGALAGSIKYLVDDTKGRVGTDNPYATSLENGTSMMEPRPFLRTAIEDTKDDIRRILSRSE